MYSFKMAQVSSGGNFSPYQQVVWLYLASLSWSPSSPKRHGLLRSIGSCPALKLLILCILYNLSDHELQPAMGKHYSTTKFPNSWLPSRSTRSTMGPHYYSLKEMTPSSLQSRPTPRLPLLKFNIRSEVFKHREDLPQARVP